MARRYPDCVMSVLLLRVGAVPQPDGGTIERGVLPARWFSQGPKCMEIPEWQVHEYNPNPYILRRSPCIDFERPFIYLFFGKDKALLMDTGSRNGNLAPTLRRNRQELVAAKLQAFTGTVGDAVCGAKHDMEGDDRPRLRVCIRRGSKYHLTKVSSP